MYGETQQTLEDDVQEVLTAKSMTHGEHLSNADRQFQADLRAKNDETKYYKLKAAELAKKASRLVAVHKSRRDQTPNQTVAVSGEHLDRIYPALSEQQKAMAIAKERLLRLQHL